MYAKKYSNAVREEKEEKIKEKNTQCFLVISTGCKQNHEAPVACASEALAAVPHPGQ